MSAQPSTDASDPSVLLSPEQIDAFNAYRKGENIFLTGPGGTGKTHLIRIIYEDALERMSGSVQVCAMTGCAALLLECDAKTLHSWAGIGIAKDNIVDICSSVCTNQFKLKAWTSTTLLIVDEVSMMSSHMFNLLDHIGRTTRRRQGKPFGGIQVIFSGDFFQLPPIRDGAKATGEFCFESPLWTSTFHRTVELTTQFRQTDHVYAQVLNEIREGILSEASSEILNERLRITSTLATELEDDSFVIPRLLPIRSKVLSINARKYRELGGVEEAYKLSVVPADTLNLTSKQMRKYRRLSSVNIAREVKRLINNRNLDEVFKVKVGTQVMCIVNIDMDTSRAIANGSQGVVVGFTGRIPRVKFRSGLERDVNFHVFKSNSVRGVAVKQIPLMYAWAISIHKSQGATFDTARVDIGSNVFACGQTYVALSRLRTLEGLYINEFDPHKIRVNQVVQQYYLALRHGKGGGGKGGKDEHPEGKM